MLDRFFNIPGGRTTTGWNIATTGLSVLSNLFLARQQRRVDRQSNEAALRAYESQVNQMRIQQQQINQQAAGEMSDIALQAARERARLDAIAGEYGAAGNIAQRMAVENAFASNAARTRVELNRRNQIAQTAREMQAMRAQALSAQHRTSLAPTALRLAGDVLNFAGGLSPRAPQQANTNSGWLRFFNQNFRINRENN